MRRVALILTGLAAGVAVMAIAGVVYVRTTRLESRSSPGPVERSVARLARRLAVPAADRERRNPLAPSADTLAEGMAHFADHCASCHANDGSGNTEMGRGLFPKAPDMRLAATQQMTDGELFYVIEHGIRFTGMPAWGTGTPAGEQSTWHLVQFIRHLPQVSAAELETMKQMNPRSPEEIRQEIEEDRFLNQ